MRLYKVRTAAELLGVSARTVRFWIWTRKIDYVKVGRAVRLREDTIQKLIERGTVPAKRA